VKIAHEMLLPAKTGPADPQREEARLVAARALATQARLLCGSAKLLAPQTAGLPEAEQELTALDKTLEQGKGAPAIDAAARARASCLGVLTKARRAAQATGAGQADALLAELSAAGGWDPTRDERGVVVTLRNVWKGNGLAPEMEARLKELGRVASAHPGFAVQVVVHDATHPSPAEQQANTQRAEAAVKALTAGGAAAGKVKGETAGARNPVVDPQDAKARARNARVEIVFVSP
jgi:outer membrane protein OmpA-like peptidoglycan-associated protein